MIINNITTTGDYTILPTKKDILKRLFEQGHISFDEMWILLQSDPDVRYVMMPDPYPFVNPYPDPIVQYKISIDDTSNREFHNSSGGTADTE